METINCIFCKHPRAEQVIYENDYFGKQCVDCNLIYICPRPCADEIADIYGHDQAQLSAQSHIKGSYLKRLYARHTLRIIKKFLQTGNVLEIGAGGGYFLDEARVMGFSPFALELNGIQSTFIKTELGIPCEQAPLNSNSFGGETFDLIYHCDVLSHFHDPVKAFGLMLSKLKAGGYLVFETGNIGDIDKSYYSLFSAFQYPDHLFFFAHSNVKSLLEQTGFVCQTSYRYSIVPQLLFQRQLHKLFGKKVNSPKIQQKTMSDNKMYQQGFAKKIYYHLLYTLRYKVGALVPKHKKPQTIIFVAQKPKD